MTSKTNDMPPLDKASAPGTTDEELIDGGKVMSLFEHLTELRHRLIKAVLAVVAFFCVALAFSNDILDFLKQPLLLNLPEEHRTLHFTGPLDVFLVGIKVSMLTALVWACPVWLYQFWKFIEPALYKRERRFILPFITLSVLLFVLGISFCYFLILPLGLEFLINMGLEVGTPIITITDYISVLTLMIFAFGLIFETPVILILLASLDVISAESLSAHRRIVIVATLVIGAILTPPDPLSQIGMAIPLYLMYELSIVVIRILQRKRRTS